MANNVAELCPCFVSFFVFLSHLRVNLEWCDTTLDPSSSAAEVWSCVQDKRLFRNVLDCHSEFCTEGGHVPSEISGGKVTSQPELLF